MDKQDAEIMEEKYSMKREIGPKQEKPQQSAMATFIAAWKLSENSGIEGIMIMTDPELSK